MSYTHDWLVTDWKKLKSQLIRLCCRHVDELLDSAGCYQPEQFSAFIGSIYQDIQQRTRGDNIGLWQECLPLLSDMSPLEKQLPSQFHKAGVNAGPAAILGQSLGYFLEQARRSLYAEQKSETPARVKTWERVNRLSLSLALESDTYSNDADRCTEEHFQAVHEHIRAEHPGDYNYPQRLQTIEELFYIFCACCLARIETMGEDTDAYPLGSTAGSSLADQLFDRSQMDNLQRALNLLDDPAREILDAAFNLGLQPMGYISANAYMRSKQITASQFESRKREALQQLLTFFEQQNPMAVTGSQS